MVDAWDEVNRVNAGSGTFNRLDTQDNNSCLFHTGGGGQGCIVFRPEDPGLSHSNFF